MQEADMEQATADAQAFDSPDDALEEGLVEQEGESPPDDPGPAQSGLHLVIGHEGKPHVSSDDAGKLMSLTLGSGRYIMEGLDVRISSATTVVVEAGCILADGRFIRLPAPQVVELENGQIGRNRIDQLRIRYECFANGAEQASFVMVTGTPSTGAASVPLNEHTGNILNHDRIVDIPLANLPKSGLTPGTPVRLLPTWVWPPANTDMNAYIDQISKIMSDVASATAAAWEVVRAVPADLQQMRDDIAGMRDWLEQKQAQNEAQIRQLAAMLANNIAAYVMVGDTLAAPSAWVGYDPEAETLELAYTSRDEETGGLRIDAPLSVGSRIDAVAAELDYVLMISGEE